MDHKIAVGRIAIDDRSDDCDHVLFKIRVVGADLVAGASAFRGIEILHYIGRFRVAFGSGRSQDFPVLGKKPDRSAKLCLHAGKLKMDVV